MKKYCPLLIMLVIMAFGANAQNFIHLYSDSTSVSNDATSSAIMTKRLKKDAEQYVQFAPIPRMAEIDYSFGADLISRLRGAIYPFA